MKVTSTDSIWCFTHDHWVCPNPGYTVPSDRDDGRETIMWLNHPHEVQSIDLVFEGGNLPDGKFKGYEVKRIRV